MPATALRHRPHRGVLRKFTGGRMRTVGAMKRVFTGGRMRPTFRTLATPIVNTRSGPGRVTSLSGPVLGGSRSHGHHRDKTSDVLARIRATMGGLGTGKRRHRSHVRGGMIGLL